MLLPRTLPALAAVALALSVGACGKDQTVSAKLRGDTAAVVTALNAQNARAARAALDILEADVIAAGRFQQLDAAQVTALRAGVARLRADLALITPVVVPTTPPTTVAPTPSGGKKKHGHND